jgi:hypothetical protein
VSSTAALNQTSSVIRTLTTQHAELKQRHRGEVHALQQALETAQGENLELRRTLGHNRSHQPNPMTPIDYERDRKRSYMRKRIDKDQQPTPDKKSA